MRKIDPTKIDLSKLALSETGVPIGFRELLPEEFPSNGDVYDQTDRDYTVYDPRFKIQVNQPAGGAKDAYRDRVLNHWFKHYRLLEVPDAIPANYGKVTGGVLKDGDFRFDPKDNSFLPVHFAANGRLVDSIRDFYIYRKQPAFPAVKKTFERCIRMYNNIEIPTGFRELNHGESREGCIRWRDAVAGWVVCEWDGTYDASCNPSMVRIEPVSDKAPRLTCETQVPDSTLPAKDYKSAVDKVQVKIDPQTKQIRELQARHSADEAANGILRRQLDGQQETTRHYVDLATERYTEIQNLRAQLDKASEEARESAKAVVARTNEIEELKAQLWKLGGSKGTDREVDDIGTGYRELLHFESTSETDEFSYAPGGCVTARNWVPRGDVGPSYTNYGELLRMAFPGFKYRRKVEPTYRLLADHEVPKIGDEFRYFGNDTYGVWTPKGYETTTTIAEVKRMGCWDSGYYLEYRRKVS